MNKKQYKNKKEDDFFDELEEENYGVLELTDEDEDSEIIPDEDEDDDEEDFLEEEEEELKTKKTSKIKAKKEDFYVEPQKFDEEIMKYYDTGVMSDELANMISKIAHKLSFAGNFINYSIKNDMIGDAIIRMMKALISKKYNRDKGSNPFSYFTRIAFNGFINRIKREKHIHETHEKYRQELMMMTENYNTTTKNKNGNNKNKNY